MLHIQKITPRISLCFAFIVSLCLHSTIYPAYKKSSYTGKDQTNKLKEEHVVWSYVQQNSFDSLQQIANNSCRTSTEKTSGLCLWLQGYLAFEGASAKKYLSLALNANFNTPAGDSFKYAAEHRLLKLKEIKNPSLKINSTPSLFTAIENKPEPSDSTKKVATEKNPITDANWVIQLGAFRSQENALSLKKRLTAKKIESILDSTLKNGKPLYVLRSPTFASSLLAEEFGTKKLKPLGISYYVSQQN